jgi:hypothetical protein
MGNDEAFVKEIFFVGGERRKSFVYHLLARNAVWLVKEKGGGWVVEHVSGGGR